MTIDEDDVHILNGEKLQLGLDSQQPDREPIFKLVWSGYSDSEDPRGGATTLVILGGRNDNVTGVLAFHLPAFNPPEPPADTTVTDGIHPTFRAAMRAAVTPSDIYLYATPTPVVDFMLIPKTSPHFGGSYDPQSILILTEAQGGTRTLEARKFPPPQFNPHSIHSVTPAPAAVSHATTPTPTTVDVEDDLTATLAAMDMIDDPQEIELPPSLWSGKNAPIHPVLIKLERDAHTKLTHGRQENLQLPLSGGQAWPVETPDSRLSKVSFTRGQQDNTFLIGTNSLLHIELYCRTIVT
jgi:syntaxin-binding protein 5